MAKELSDYFKEYSYGKKNAKLLQIYQKMWEGGCKLGDYGRYLRNPSQFEEKRLFSVLRDIGFWKAGQRWLAKGFDRNWSFLNIKNTFSSVNNSISILGTRVDDRSVISILTIRKKTRIPGFGKRTGSAILTIMYPDLYGIIDYRVWRALNDRWLECYNLDFRCRFKNLCKRCYKAVCKYIQGTVNSSDFNLEECERYFKGIRKIADLADMNPRQIDMALWEYDIQHSKSE
jgi:hypothetical protein